MEIWDKFSLIVCQYGVFSSPFSSAIIWIRNKIWVLYIVDMPLKLIIITMKVEMNEICVGYAIRAIIFVDSTRDTQTKV